MGERKIGRGGEYFLYFFEISDPLTIYPNSDYNVDGSKHKESYAK